MTMQILDPLVFRHGFHATYDIQHDVHRLHHPLQYQQSSRSSSFVGLPSLKQFEVNVVDHLSNTPSHTLATALLFDMLQQALTTRKDALQVGHR